MSFSNKKSYYFFNPTIDNYSLLDTFNDKIDKKLLNNLFKRQKITFVWKNVELEFVNSLRRAIIANIPTFSIDRVDFFERSSQSETNETNEFYLFTRKRPVQNNEQIKLRLDLIPVKQDYIKNVLPIFKRNLNFINLIQKENDISKRIYITEKDVVPKFTYSKIDISTISDDILTKVIIDNLVIEFDVINSLNHKNNSLFLQGFTNNIWLNVCSDYFSVKLELFDENLKEIKSELLKLPNDLLFDDNYLITRIKRGQYLKFKAYLNKGDGSINSKYTSVCSVSYLPIPNVYLDDIDNNISEINNIHWSLEQEIPEDPENFLITLQSLEYETPENIFIQGFDNLQIILQHTKEIFNKMNRFIEIKNQNSLTFERSTMSLNSRLEQEKDSYFIEFLNDTEIRFILLDIGYTFCNWFQNRLLLNDKVEFCGYQNPHPKIKEMNMYIRFKENSQNKVQLFIETIDIMINRINEYKIEFSNILQSNN